MQNFLLTTIILIWLSLDYLEVHQKDLTEYYANSEDLDQTASLKAVWYVSKLFALAVCPNILGIYNDTM